MTGQFSAEMEAAASEIRSRGTRVKKLHFAGPVANPAIELVQKMGIDSLRAEITWFESARAYAAADGRDEVTAEDLRFGRGCAHGSAFEALTIYDRISQGTIE